MSRRQKHVPGPFFPPFDLCVVKADDYAEMLNIKPVILPLPAVDEAIHDLLGLQNQLNSNRSFLKSDLNPNPEVLPRGHFIKDDSMTVHERISSLMARLTEHRPGLIVMFVEGTKGVSLRRHQLIEGACQPICGIIIQFGREMDELSMKKRDDQTDISLERGIIGAFCSPSLPEDVAEELLRVNLIRSIAESLCFEEVQQYRHDEETRDRTLSSVDSPNRSLHPSRESRFMSIEMSDALLCPSAILKCIQTLQFKMHVENDILSSTVHEEVLSCNCFKEFDKAVAAGTSESDYFNFYMLKCGRVKEWIVNHIPETPSDSVVQYFNKRKL